jgi:aquaporin Z
MANNKAVPTSAKTTAAKPVVSARKTSTVKAVQASNETSLAGSVLRNAPFIGTLVAEFIGTLLLAVAVIAGQGQPIIIMFAIAGVVLLVGTLSGAHLNPAITVGAWLTRRVSGLRALGYVAAQFLGGFAAFGLMKAFISGAPAVSASAQAYGQTAPALYQAANLTAGKEWYVFFAELVGTLVLGFAIATALNIKRDRVASALTVGFGLFIGLLLAASAASYVSGTSILNPAVAVSLQALKMEAWPLAVYVLAPVIGAVAGFFLQGLLKVENDGSRD